jgi:hypothetical protein
MSATLTYTHVVCLCVCVSGWVGCRQDLSDSNQFIRALSLRVLSGIRIEVIVPIVVMAVRKCAGDMSPYVRKTAAHAIPKVRRAHRERERENVRRAHSQRETYMSVCLSVRVSTSIVCVV